MQLIALTGGIAAGKSTVGGRLAELGAIRIDADQLARDAVAPGSPGLAKVVSRFGVSLLEEDGSLNRAALGERVFASPEELQALNAIVHPEVRRLADEAIQAAARSRPDAVIVYEIPLLVESGVMPSEGGLDWDMIVVAEAPVETRVARLVELRGMTEAEARNRIANQASDAARREIADVVIDTSGTKGETIEQVDALWRRIAPASSAT
ncbi:dephospho-CoA kinase [Leucobacter aridicollis]|uniref:dephospho-CoA kinase n=1 Tax=Leucobacter aridicollis TaxID=283878 RepID=UPI000E648F83|nr:dephospho-CoA kinase [Leucobacter aridicollis]UTX54445.1 dephospho-CoA kinase, long form [Leucobacter aridicollis]